MAFESLSEKLNAAFKKLRGDNKELFIIKGANHTDLYDDRAGVIPYGKMEKFFRDNLK